MTRNYNTTFSLKLVCFSILFLGCSIGSYSQSLNVRESKPVNTIGVLSADDWNNKINQTTMYEGFSDEEAKLKAANHREFDINTISTRLGLLEEALNSSSISTEQRIEFEAFRTNLLTRKLNLLNAIIELELEFNSMTTFEIEVEISHIKNQLK